MVVEVGSRNFQVISGVNAKINLGAEPVANAELIMQIDKYKNLSTKCA
jgi:hypothetical protein